MGWHYPLLDRLTAAKPRRGRQSPLNKLKKHRALDAALAAAWDTAGPQGRARITALQLTRQTPGAAQNLIAHLHHLEAPARTVLLDRVSELHAALRHTLTRNNTGHLHQSRVNALWLIEHGDAGTLAYLAVPELRHTDPTLRQAAENCLCGLARGQHPAAQHRSSHCTDNLNQAIQRAVADFPIDGHLGALRAWLALGPAAFDLHGPALTALQNPEHPAVSGLRALAKEAATPDIRRGLVGLLGIPNIALAAVAGLRHCAAQAPTQLAEALHGRTHLIDLPAVHRGLTRGGNADALWPETADQAPLHPCNALPAWATALGGSPTEQLTRLGPLTASGPLARRLDALRRITQLLCHPKANNHLRRVGHTWLEPLAADSNPALASLAGTCLLRCAPPAANSPIQRTPSLTTPAPPTRHPTPHVLTAEHCRRAATRRMAATAFEPLWHSWSRLPAHHRHRAAATALRLDPSARRRLRLALDSHNLDIRHHAQVITQTLKTSDSLSALPLTSPRSAHAGFTP
ncbi:MAG: hypothetical protein V3V20_01375 [Algisphaera sp.]